MEAQANGKYSHYSISDLLYEMFKSETISSVLTVNLRTKDLS